MLDLIMVYTMTSLSLTTGQYPSSQTEDCEVQITFLCLRTIYWHFCSSTKTEFIKNKTVWNVDSERQTDRQREKERGESCFVFGHISDLKTKLGVKDCSVVTYWSLTSVYQIRLPPPTREMVCDSTGTCYFFPDSPTSALVTPQNRLGWREDRQIIKTLTSQYYVEKKPKGNI